MKKKQKIRWLSGVALACVGCLFITSLKEGVEATQIGVSHLGTFEGNTTFTTSSESGIAPGLFVEIIDDKGNLTQYESEDGVISIPNTKEGAYVTQAKFLGKTKYIDQDTGEILDSWEEGRDLELVSVENPKLTTVGKNLYTGENLTIGKYIGNTGLLTNANTDVLSDYIEVKPNTAYAYKVMDERAQTPYGCFAFYDKDKNFISRSQTTHATNTTHITPANCYYVRVWNNSYIECGNEIPNVMLVETTEKPSLLTTYVPYQSNVLTLSEDVVLREVNETQDTYDLMIKEYVKNIEETVLNGSETWIRMVKYDIDGFISFEIENFVGMKLHQNYTGDKAHILCDRLFTYTYKSDNGTVYSQKEFVGTWSNTERVALFTRVQATKLSSQDVNGFKSYLNSNPLTVQYELRTPEAKTVGLKGTYQFPLVNKSQVQLKGEVSPVITSITIPTSELAFILDSNQEAGQQFIAPEFEVTNESNAPLNLTLKTFEQTTDVLNDVLPTKYESWDGLTKEESKDIALGLVSKPSDDWLSRVEEPHYVSETDNNSLGAIKPKGTIAFEFTAHHGQSFSEPLTPSYRMTFVFDLLS